MLKVIMHTLISYRGRYVSSFLFNYQAGAAKIEIIIAVEKNVTVDIFITVLVYKPVLTLLENNGRIMENL